MVSFAPTNPDTLEDRRLYTEARLVEVACAACLVRVAVKKNSEHHTSIQWPADGPARCPEFSRATASPEGRPVHRRCEELAASIDAAVREGRLAIGAEDGY